MKRWLGHVGNAFLVVVYLCLAIGVLWCATWALDSRHYIALAAAVFVGVPLVFGSMFYVVSRHLDS